MGFGLRAGDRVFLNLAISSALKYGIKSGPPSLLGQPVMGVPPGDLGREGGAQGRNVCTMGSPFSGRSQSLSPTRAL